MLSRIIATWWIAGALGLLCAPAVHAEPQTLASQRWQGTADPGGLARTHSGALLSHLDVDVALTSGYERNPLWLRTGIGSGVPAVLPFVLVAPGQRGVRLIGERLATELTLSMGLFNWLQVFAAAPVTLFQGRGEGAAQAGGELDPLSQLNAGDVRIGAKVRLLRQSAHFVDAAFVPMVTLPVGLGLRLFRFEGAGVLPLVRPDAALSAWAQGYTSEGFPTLQPELALSRELYGFVAAGNLGLRLRRPYELHGITVTHELLARAGLAFKGRRLAEKLPAMKYFPVELGLEAVAAAPINLPYVAAPPVTPGADRLGMVIPRLFQSYQHSLELTGHAGVDVIWMHPFVTASVGVVSGYGTPDFRIGAGVRFSTELGLDKPSTPRQPDRDADRVSDDDDQCPDVYGVVENGGCPVIEFDSDVDGVGDATDRCPAAKEDLDGFADDDGCPDEDDDHDGVADAEDGCPLDAEAVNGVDDEDGCPDEEQPETLEWLEGMGAHVEESSGGVAFDGAAPDATGMVVSGTTVRTMSDGHALLRLADGRVVIVAPETEVALWAHTSDDEGEEAAAGVELKVGSIEIIAPVQSEGSTLDATTPHAVAQSAGGRFRLHAGELSRVEVLDGTVQWTTPEESTDVEAGQLSVADGAGRVEAPAPLLRSNGVVEALHGELTRGATIKWRPVENAAAFRLHFARDAAFTREPTSVVIAATQLLVPPLPPGRWFWRVSPVDSSGREGLPSHAYSIEATAALGEGAVP